MNLDDLKPAWRQFRLSNSMQSIQQKEILLMLERAESMAINKTDPLMMNSFMFIVLTTFCQGG